ncbi:hypothetical protein J1N35_042833 [Gossypium stocksii]|uniref:RNase H type-1 domain-containing protein n=1 Tax=Gossypium stocksii TaxID=47602 RepID=A0A9D3U673_9ROSI|nr:hypothetical protein J1N35_042833 [Gossypium stocksii]
MTPKRKQETDLGIVIRADHGCVTGAAVQKVGNVGVCAIQAGLEMAVFKGFTSLEVESDSLLAIQEVEKRDEPCWDCFTLVLDLHDIVLDCRKVVFNYMKRDCNKLAHSPSRLTCQAGEVRVCDASLPYFA